jgi:hypothetical protein
MPQRAELVGVAFELGGQVLLLIKSKYTRNRFFHNSRRSYILRRALPVTRGLLRAVSPFDAPGMTD